MEEYAIQDIEGYASSMRSLCIQNNISGENTTEVNADEYITLKEVMSLITQHCNELTEEGQIIVNEETHTKIFNEMSDWVYGIGLAKLASKNLVECAWDNDQNNMVFWSPEKPTNEKRKSSRTKRQN